MKTIVVTLFALALCTSGAQARHMRPAPRPVECALFCINLTTLQDQLGDVGRVISSPRVHHSASVVQSAARPRDCYGIEWCGCWLRHYFGLADRSLNLARRWA